LALVSFAIQLSGSPGVLAFDLAEPGPSQLAGTDLWTFLPIGYAFTVAVETPVLVAGLSRDLRVKHRLFAGFWLTACTYPIVILVFPILFSSTSRAIYLTAAEVFAPVAECTLFWLVFKERIEGGLKVLLRNFAVIIGANLASFGLGELLNRSGWFGLFQV
jgi:hypothetical protein